MNCTCDICQKGIEDGPLYRTNPKGQDGIWRHEKCGIVPHAIDKEICEIIDQNRNQG